jgi:hypothetical protein
VKRCRAAIVFWSGTSVASNNVRQEATIASNVGKLVQVMFELLRTGLCAAAKAVGQQPSLR